MLNYDNDARRQFAREQAERLADEMRRSRRLTPNEAGYPSRASMSELLRRAARLGRAKEPKPRAPAYDA
jgi:hypothetical protein